jgi:hypothetical protein
LVNLGFIATAFFLQILGTTLLIAVEMTMAFALMVWVHQKRKLLRSTTDELLQGNKNSPPSFPSLLLAPKPVEIN